MTRTQPVHSGRTQWQPPTAVSHFLTCLSSCLLVSAMVACGGGEKGASLELAAQTGDAQGAQAFAAPESDAMTRARLQEGARLNAAELEAIAKAGVLPTPFDGQLLSGTESGAAIVTQSMGEAKSAASRTAVYRFFNTQTSAHFFTTSVTERDNVQATLPHMTYEGPAFYASGSAVPGLSPVHRFYNTRNGVHFYTITESERAHIAATLPHFSYDGIAYYASTLAGTGYTPLYRFFYAARGFHFYTNSAAEKDNIMATLPQYSYEGVGYYVLGSDWQTPSVPHTGITENQCYQAGSNTLVACSTAGALALNPQQDGHRTAINPMSYSDLVSGYFGTFPVIFPLYFPRTDCVRDNVTGLVLEGKADGGMRAGSNRYTNYGDGRAGDVSAYVNTVNAMNLCGFNDWRLPQVEELHGLMAYGESLTLVDPAYFPNTPGQEHWSVDAYVSVPGTKWTVDFWTGGPNSRSVSSIENVRLVRGAPWTGSRYLITSVHYLTDGANNAVVDRKTGLTWRRCLEGQFWTGSACAGSATSFSHPNALIRGASIAGWRLPNIKELASLSDLSREIPALDERFFPGADGGFDTWSSTPRLGVSAYAWSLASNNGNFSPRLRTSNLAVHLVRTDP